ncbi:MAG: hypothetical protein WDZ45_04520 [Flavobacteriaceae bacterium]
MGKITILYKPEVEYYINDLVHTLYLEGYFSFLENAVEYTNGIIDFIENAIHTFPYKITPLNLNHLGSKYIFYNPNKRTTWFIFFESQEDTFLVTYITNNHAETAGQF